MGRPSPAFLAELVVGSGHCAEGQRAQVGRSGATVHAGGNGGVDFQIVFEGLVQGVVFHVHIGGLGQTKKGMVGIAGAHAGGQTVGLLFLQGCAVDADFLDALTTGGVGDKSDFHAGEAHQPAAEAFHGVGGKNVVDFFFQPVEQLLSAYLSGFNVIVDGQHVVNVAPRDGGCSSVFRNYGVAEAEAVGQRNVGTGLPAQGT